MISCSTKRQIIKNGFAFYAHLSIIMKLVKPLLYIRKLFATLKFHFLIINSILRIKKTTVFLKGNFLYMNRLHFANKEFVTSKNLLIPSLFLWITCTKCDNFTNDTTSLLVITIICSILISSFFLHNGIYMLFLIIFQYAIHFLLIIGFPIRISLQ